MRSLLKATAASYGVAMPVASESLALAAVGVKFAS